MHRLKAHLALEESARRDGNGQLLSRLTGEFHVLLAEMHDNSLLMDIMRRLVTLSRLIIYVHESPLAHVCPEYEYGDLVAATEARDSERAGPLMIEHLDHVQGGLRFAPEAREDLDLGNVFTSPKV